MRLVLGDKKAIEVALSEYKGETRLDLRTYIKTSTEDWIPTKAGISIPVERGNDILKLIAAVITPKTPAANPKVRYAIGPSAGEGFTQGPFKNLSVALEASGEAGEFIFEVSGTKASTKLYKWSTKRGTWIEKP